MARGQGTRDRILDAARDVIDSGGFGALTYDAVARRLGVTKQAVIYWFPTKQDLAREICVPLLKAEADSAMAALAGARGTADAIARFVRAIVGFHAADLARFRQMYLAVQVSKRPDLMLPRDVMAEEVYPVTGRMYGALAATLAEDPEFRPALSPRRAAAAVHMAALGVVMMVALADTVDDPLAHATDDLVDTLVAMLCGGAAGG